jgi:hypothetical protein
MLRHGPNTESEANRLGIALGVHDKNQAPFDRSDGDEPILFIGVGVIEDLQVVISPVEQGTRFLKRNAMLLPIRAAPGFIPDDPHRPTMVQGPTNSMA